MMISVTRSTATRASKGLIRSLMEVFIKVAMIDLATSSRNMSSFHIDDPTVFVYLMRRSRTLFR